LYPPESSITPQVQQPLKSQVADILTKVSDKIINLFNSFFNILHSTHPGTGQKSCKDDANVLTHWQIGVMFLHWHCNHGIVVAVTFEFPQFVFYVSNLPPPKCMTII